MTAPTGPRLPGGGQPHPNPPRLVLDLFAGPGGWSEGLRAAGYHGVELGVEWDETACRTAEAAGHLRIRADVARFPAEEFAGLVLGLIGSPPCTTFSSAGHGAGRLVTAVLLTAMTRMARGGKVLAWARREIARALAPLALEKYPKYTRAERSAWCRKQAVTTALVLQPLRFTLAVRPRWIALEQVREVQPLWTHLAVLLREMGYRVWTGVLDAERYGVPQTRKRAILTASLDGPVTQPEPTHQGYRRDGRYEQGDDLFGSALPRPVSMAEALGWTDGLVVSNYGSGGDASDRGERDFNEPAATVTGKVGRNRVVAQARNSGPGAERDPRSVDAPSYTIRSAGSGSHPSGTEWVLRNGNQANACERRACEPAGTLFFSSRTNAVDWVPVEQYERQANGGRRSATVPPSLTITASLDNGNLRWTHERPATTVCADARLGPPGHRDRAGGERQFGEGSVRVTVEEASLLQSFRPGYPWQGTKSKQYEGVGNAVPPLLSAAVLRPLLTHLSAAAAA